MLKMAGPYWNTFRKFMRTINSEYGEQMDS